MRESNEEVHKRANMEAISKEKKVDMDWARAANGQQFPPTSGHELQCRGHLRREEVLEKHGVGQWNGDRRCSWAEAGLATADKVSKRSKSPTLHTEK